MVAARLNLWLPVVFWAGVIFALSSVSGLSTDLGVWDTILRKCAHVVEYAILGALLQRALWREPLAVLIGAAYAVTDELHQSFVSGRQGTPLDLVIDAVGVVLGVLVFSRLAR